MVEADLELLLMLPPSPPKYGDYILEKLMDFISLWKLGDYLFSDLYGDEICPRGVTLFNSVLSVFELDVNLNIHSVSRQI